MMTNGHERPWTIDRAVGHQIQVLRTLQGITNTELAARVNCDLDALRRRELGVERCEAEFVLQVADALGVRPSKLFELVPLSPKRG